jgi:hypothetical protein
MMSGQNVKIDNLDTYPLNSFGFGVKASEQLTTTIARVDRSTEVNSAANQDRINLA